MKFVDDDDDDDIVVLIIPFTSTAVGRKAFRYAAPTVWNSMPFNIRHSPSIGSFKRHLKRTFSPSPVSHVLHLATPAPLSRFSKLARYKSCNNNNNNNIINKIAHNLRHDHMRMLAFSYR